MRLDGFYLRPELPACPIWYGFLLTLWSEQPPGKHLVLQISSLNQAGCPTRCSRHSSDSFAIPFLPCLLQSNLPQVLCWGIHVNIHPTHMLPTVNRKREWAARAGQVGKSLRSHTAEGRQRGHGTGGWGNHRCMPSLIYVSLGVGEWPPLSKPTWHLERPHVLSQGWVHLPDQGCFLDPSLDVTHPSH